MYLKHFNLAQEPFSIAPDPSFLYLSEGHREALAHLLYGFSHGGFVLVTVEVGTGKTTLLRNLIKQTPTKQYKAGVKARRFAAAMDNDYLLDVLSRASA